MYSLDFRRMTVTKLVSCPACEGEGETMTNASHGPLRDPQQDVPVRCSECQGTGYVEDTEGGRG